jgi:hypothetical protein
LKYSLRESEESDFVGTVLNELSFDRI